VIFVLFVIQLLVSCYYLVLNIRIGWMCFHLFITYFVFFWVIS
jgi:hypothetical protein